MKYGKDLISRGASTTRTPAMTAVIFANLRGTVRIKSVCAMAKIAGTKNGRVSAPCRFQGFNRDPSNGMSYVAHLLHRAELCLVMPVRQWNE